jgi:hypothetical protein
MNRDLYTTNQEIHGINTRCNTQEVKKNNVKTILMLFNRDNEGESHPILIIADSHARDCAVSENFSVFGYVKLDLASSLQKVLFKM